MIVTQTRFSFLLGIGFFLCAVEGFVVWFRPTTLQPMPIVDTTKIRLGYRDSNSRQPPYYAPLHAVKKNFKTTSIDTSIDSKKIREIASFVCVQLLQIAMTAENLNDDDDDDDGAKTDSNLEAVEKLTGALQMSQQQSEEESSAASVVVEPSSPIPSPLPLPSPLPVSSQRTENSTPILDRPGTTSAFVSATPEDTATDGASIDEDEADDTGVDSKLYPEGSAPLPLTDAPSYSVSPLEVVVSDVVPLRPFSIPQKQTIPIVVAVDVSTKDETPTETSMTTAKSKSKSNTTENTKKVDELFQRNLLQKRIQYDSAAAAAVARTELLQITPTPQNADVSSEDMHASGLLLEEQQKSEELFRRKLLKRQLDNSAKTYLTPKIESALPKKSASENHSNTLELIDTQKLLESEEESKVDEVFQRRLLAKKLEYDAEVVAQIQIKADEVFQRRLLSKKIDYDTKAIETKRREVASLAAKSSIATQSAASKPNECISISEKKRSTKKFEYAAKAIEIIQQEYSASKAVSMASKSIEDISSSENETKKADETDYDAKKIGMDDEKFQEDSLEDNEIIASNAAAERAIEIESRKTEELFRRRLLGEAIKYNSRAGRESGVVENVPPSSKSISKKDSTGNAMQANVPISDEESNPNPMSMPLVRDETNVKDDASKTSSRDDWVSSLPTVTQERYARKARLSHSFEQKEFRPTKWSLNNHFQTIVGTLFRKETMYSRGAKDDVGTFLEILSAGNVDASDEMRKPLEEFQWDKRCRVETNDGDYFVVDWKYANHQNNYGKPATSTSTTAIADLDDDGCDDDDANQSSSSNDDNPVCLICHGLESCSDSEIVQEIAIACNEIKIDVACLNFRGCHDSGGECNLTARGYHLGFTDDLMQQIEEIHGTNPNRRIYLSGFSLGAGVVTKLLVELGEKAYDYNICGAAVNAVPFDCGQNYKAINEPGFTKLVYGDRLLKSMKTRLSKLHDQDVFTFDKSVIEKCQNIMEIENLAIAPPFGFEDAYDYYDKVKTVDKLQKVCVPQFVIQARDDPFFVGLEEVANDETMPLQVQYTKHGGHCGYIFHQRDSEERHSKTSWMPRQLARFFSHIEETSVDPESRNNRVVVVAEQSAATRDCLV